MPVTIYGASLSPFVRKVLVFAAEKGIDIDHAPVGLQSADPEFRKASPFGKIPGMKHGDFYLSDSSAIVTYLEGIKPDPALIPKALKAHAKTIWYDEFADTIHVAASGPIFFNRIVAPRFMKQPGDQAAADKAEQKDLPPVLAYVESVMPASGHLIEDRLTLADIAVASPFVNLAHAGITIDAAQYPKIAAFLKAMWARPSFAKLIAMDKKILGH